MKSFLTSLLTLLAIMAAAALVVTFTGITPGFHDNVAKAQTTTGTQPAAGSTQTPTATGNIIQTLTASGQFTQALAAIELAGLTQTLASGGPFTVFAPTDAAFAKVPPATLQATLSSPGQLKQVLSYHVVPGIYSSAQLANVGQLQTLEGSSVAIMTNNGVLMVGNAAVTQSDIQATNGVIHAIDSILQLPASAATATPTASPTATPSVSPSASPSPSP